MSITSVKNDILTRESVINAFTPLAPTISSYNILVDAVIIDDTAVDTAGGQTIQINGTSFAPGAIITLDGSAVTTAYVSPNKLTFTAPVKIAGTYAIYVVNLDGGTAIYIPGIVYSGTPVWTTASGSLGSIYETNSISTTAFTTTGDAPITYSLYSGTLPTGSSLNTSTGVITGTAPVDSGSTVYSFTIKATDAQLQDSLQNFTLTINTDTVTWSTPASGSTTTISQNANSTTTLLATSAAGKAITYSSTALPTGLSISGATVIGTPTVLGTTATTFTATAATTGRTTTAVINWTISVANDVYFMYTPLLLSGGTSTETFIADASVNNFALTIAGDTKPNNFNPYTPGYYSNYIPTTSDYYYWTDTLSGNFGTGDFTVEGWFYLSASAHNIMNPSTGTSSWGFLTYGSQFYWQENGGNYGGTGYGTVPINQWVHLAVSRTGGYLNLYINGVRVLNSANTFNYSGTPTRYIGPSGSTSGLYWMSNIRFIKGTGIYSGATVTVPTSPLTAIANTSLLTVQSNRMIDNSTNAVVFTKAGSPQIQSFTPFVPNTAYATQGSTYFDGTGDYLTAPSNSAFGFGNSNYTIELWVYPTSSASPLSMISKGNASSVGADFWSIEFSNTSGGFSFFCGAYNGGSVIVSGTAPLNTWTHIAVVRNSLIHTLYVNGVSVSSATAGADYTVTSAGNLYIGTGSYAPASRTITGYISNARIVKGVAVYTGTFTPPATPLSATQSAGTNIAAITGSATSLLTLQTNQPANNSMFLDSSTNAFAVTRAGNTSAGTFTPYGANWSNYFDGIGDYLTATTGSSQLNLPGDFTVELWFYETSTAASIPRFASGTTGGFGCGINAYDNGGTRKLDWRQVGAAPVTAVTAITTNVWHHAAFVRSGSAFRMFLDGVLDYYNASYTTTFTSTATYIGSGNTGDNAYSFNGYINNLRVVKGTAVYVTASTTIGTAIFTPPTAPLTAIANTALLTCQSNSFVDNSANVLAITRTGEVSVQRFSPFSPQTQTANTHSVYYGTKTDYISTPATTALTTFTGDFTFECWVNPTDTSISTSWGIWDSRQDGQTASAMIFFLTALASPVTGQWRLSYYNSGSQYYGTGVVLANQWSHVAYVRSGSTLTYYVNGVAGGTTNVGAGTISGSATSNPVYIGTKDGSLSGYGTVGYISNFRIVKGVAVYTGNFTVPTAPLTATQSSGTNIAAITGTQTSLLTCQSSTLIDNSTNAYVLTPATTTVKPRTYNPLGFTNTLAGYSAAVYGGSAYFDTSGDYIAVTGAGSWVNFGTNDFTIECWCYHTNGISFFDTCPSGNPTPTNRIQLQVSGGGTVTYTTYQGTTTLITSSSGVALPNQWVHLALVKYSNQTKLYVNGTQVGSTYSDTLNYPAQTNRPILNGNGYDNSAGTSVGYISDMRIVKGTAVYKVNFVPPTAPLTAITNTSLLLNMTSAGVYNSASTNNLETVGDAKRVATQTPYAGSYYSNYFDGSGDVFTVSNNSGFNFSSDFIIEAWLYPTAFGQASCNFMTHWSSGSNVYVFRVLNTARVQFLYTAGATTLTGTSTTVSLNQWSHVAVCRSGSTLRIFVNGIADTTTATYSGTLTGGGPIAVGAHNDTSEGWTGYISNLRVVNTPSAPYTTTFTPSTTPLTSITGTALLTCQSNRFLDNSANAGTITKSGHVAVQSFNPFQRNSAATLYFDGTGDYLVAPYNPAYNFGTGNFTIEFWVNTTSTAAYATALRLGNTWTTGSWAFYLNDVNGSGVPSWWSFTLNTTLSTSGVTINDGAWHHIALVRNSTTMTMYIDGTSRGTLAVSTSSVGDTTTQLWIARDASNVRELAGYINDLRITKGVARYTTTFTPPTSSPLAY